MSLPYGHLLSIAAGRREAPSPYAGEVTAREVWDYVMQSPAYIVDVRTHAEWKFTGSVNMEGTQGKLVMLSWVNYPDFTANPDFIPQLKHIITDMDIPLFFLCRTGGRSFQAANKAAESGYGASFNITHGFEGDHNHLKQRGCVNGWKAEGLAWMQP